MTNPIRRFALPLLGALTLTATPALYAQTPAADAPAQPAASAPEGQAASGNCAPMAAIDQNRAKIEKVAALANEALVPGATLYAVYDQAGAELATALEPMPYDAACFRQIAGAINEFDAADGPDLSPRSSLGKALSDAIRRTCSEATEVAGIETCLRDTVDAVADKTYPESMLSGVLDSLPIETVRPDEAKTREILEYLKGEVDAERISESQQGRLAERLLGL